MTKRLFLIPLLLLGPQAVTAAAAEPRQGAGHPLVDLKAALTSVVSHVVGTPDRPPPYRVRRFLPKLQLSRPLAVANLPGTRRLWLLVDGPSGRPSRLCQTGDDLQSGEYETLLEFAGGVAYDIAFHPQFSENGYVYIGHNGPHPPDEQKWTQVTRYTVGRQPPFRLDTDSAQLIIQWKSNGHNGGAVAFGLDGMLYITSGDGTSDSDTNRMGQGLDHLLSKVLRINVDHPDAGRFYSIPADNPFLEMPGARPETWAYGFRNPWRMSIDPKTGNVWVGNNGQDLWEQVYLVGRGANYGWSVYEGSHLFYPNRRLGPTPVSKPMFEHPHSVARSMTGGVVYYGDRFPELQGAYIYGDYSTGKIWGAKLEGQRVLWHKELADSTLAIAGFGLDADGQLLIVDHRNEGQGGIYTLSPNDAAQANEEFPITLSETGLFEDVQGHQIAAGLIPYSVNAPLWSDGTYKERYLYLPPNPTGDTGQGSRIEMTDQRGWEFPEGTVLVKSFAFPAPWDAKKPPRWIETRLLTKQHGEWSGYSYAWNDQQTEATLVDTEGMTRSIQFAADSGQTRSQTWSYPSRTECMVCHSRAANFVLGPSTLQMNREHNYRGVTANQLEALRYLDVLDVKWSKDSKQSLRRSFALDQATDQQLDARVNETIERVAKNQILPSDLPEHWSEAFPRLVDPYDPRQELNARARSYLHANCAQCHVKAGGGNAQIDLHFSKSVEAMNVVGERPLHHTFGIDEARLVAPGRPQQSVLLHRVRMRGSGQMPQLATALVDPQGVALLSQWIEQMK